MNNAFNVLVIDDEKDARRLIKEYCKLYIPILYCYEAGTVEEAWEIISTKNIELIFLDIQLKTQSGFQLFEKQGVSLPAVIFTTAYQQHAAKAFRCAALDYLLKPIKSEEFKEATARFLEAKKVSLSEQRLSVFFENLTQPLNEVNRIALPVKEGFVIESLNQILYCKGDSNYTKIYTLRGKEYLASKTLRYFEELMPACFQRVHKSYLVNLNYVSSFHKDADTLLLADGTSLDVSVRAKAELLARFNKA